MLREEDLPGGRAESTTRVFASLCKMVNVIYVCMYVDLET